MSKNTSTAEPADASAPPAEAEAPFVMPSKGKLLLLVLVATLRRFALPIVAAVAVAALVAVAILAWQLREQRAVDDAAAAALDAARAYGTTLTSVDSNNLDQGFAAVLDGSTGEFKDMYSRSSGQLRQLLVDNKATGQGTVLDAAVKSATETKVEVLLFIDQTVTNAAAQDPRVDRSRVAMTMELVDGRWLASRVYLP
ncbi:hypothetical protein [Nocardia sp. NPDC057353]|uniref:hypothetical protein n=1 Tax=Nocardia sp. NPDC057353 TaxID=3346104 RepID=UPI003627A1EE